MSSPSPVFSVRRQAPQLIEPAVAQTPRELKHLSDIDGLWRFNTPIILFYKNNPSMKGKDPVIVIREALGRALVHYYPLAGRVREGPNKKLMVDCTGQGILFVEAEANITLEQLGDSIYPPCGFFDEFLYNVSASEGILNSPLLLFQVTRLACGGFIVAISFNHTMCDGPGIAQFLNAVAEIACGKQAPSILPIWNRELFNARDPPCKTINLRKYEDATHNSQNVGVTNSTNMSCKSFFFYPREFKALRNHLPPHLKNCTTRFELLTACLWKCRTAALGLKPDDLVLVSFPINSRGKLQNMHVPLGYYGNAFVLAAVSSMVNNLCDNPLGYVVGLVKEAKAQMSEEYAKSSVDRMVIQGPTMHTTFERMLNITLADNTHSGFDEVDFGWGKPVYGGIPWGQLGSSTYNRCNKNGMEGVLVPICLPSSVMERFQKELKIMTQRLTS
ncbi:Transferase domain-containing protein [Cephalotus follicularis]|uniref:Transferase domain-containing protein n=1 Tax=Cephalotus follicularis TaxID=3775 RepID=A0A1Q3C4D3_CEPFO|nr:Transferase domain-containing protein [Cephalotus follicularis]